MKSLFSLLIYSTIFFTLSRNTYPQVYTFSNELGKFNNASSFSITSTGFIYVTDAGTDEVYKLDTAGNVLKTAGGYGWDGGLFDHPSGIYANPLSVYISDKNNHRVERFDKDLNFFSQLSTRNSDTTQQRFGYPLGCAVSQQGDLYILDSENKRIVKFDLFGNFVINFGGYDAGNFSLTNPNSISISGNNDIYIADNDRIVIFDQYGSGLKSLKFGDVLNSCNIMFNIFTANSDSVIYFADLNSADLNVNKIKLLGIERFPEIVSSLIFNSKLYVLTKDRILIFINSM